MPFETAQVILATGVVLLLFHHRKHLSNLIWRPYVLLFFGLGTVLQLQNTSKLLCFVAWLFFVCLHHFKDLQKGNESNCPLCLEDLKTSFPYDECNRCKKATHAKCAVEYMERSGEGSFRCPVCHKDLGVKKEELKVKIERFEQLMGEEHIYSEHLKSETTENPPTTTRTTASKKSHGKLLSLLKEITLVSIMVIFYGSYQLLHDSYQGLPEDLKTFAVNVIQFVKSFTQRMSRAASIVFTWVLRTVQTVATYIYVMFSFTIPILVKDAFLAVCRSRIAELVRQKTPDALFVSCYFFIISFLIILDLLFKTLPKHAWRILSGNIRKVVIVLWHSQILSNVMNALHSFVCVHVVNAYYNVLIPLAKVLYDVYSTICESLYKVVIFVCKTLLPMALSLCKDLSKWLQIKVPELFTVILLHSRQWWFYTCLVLRQWWIVIFHSRAWIVLKWVVKTANAIIDNLLVAFKVAAVVCFCVRVAKQLSGAILPKIKELLVTSKIVLTVQYMKMYGLRVREAMLDAIWSAYNYDYNGVMCIWIESVRGVMRRVLYRDGE